MKSKRRSGLQDVTIRGWDHRDRMVFQHQGEYSRYGTKQEVERLKARHASAVRVEVSRG